MSTNLNLSQASSSLSPAKPNLPRGRARACTSCRQVKLRCNAKETYPLPCARCTTQGLDCKMDSNFKRVPAKRQLEEVSNRLSDLQKSLGLNDGRTSDSITHRGPAVSWYQSVPSNSSVQIIPSTEPSDAQDLASLEKWYQAEGREEGSWTLGDVTVDSHTVTVLLLHFDGTLYRHLPILEPCSSLHVLHQSSPILFWTILFLASSGHHIFGNLYKKIMPHHETLFAARLLDPPSLQTLHAILLLCTWPYPIKSQRDDPCWTLCGVAVNMALQMGLHKPDHSHEYIKPTKLAPGTASIRRRTWLACFQISTSLSSWHGLPPTLSSSPHQKIVALMCSSPDVPRQLQARADIQRHVVRFNTALDELIDSRTQNSLIQLFEQELGHIERAFRDVWSEDLDIELQGARLNLYSFSFIPTEPLGDVGFNRREPLSSNIRIFLQLGLTAAVRIIQLSCRMNKSNIPASSPSQRDKYDPAGLFFYPKQHYRILAYAAIFLLWFLAVDFQASESDKELAQNHVKAMHKLFMSFVGSSEHIRAAKTIELLGRMPNNVGEMSTPRVFTRLGTNFMWNALRNCMIYGNRPNLGSASPEHASEDSLEEESGEHQMATESLEADSSYQMLQGMTGDWEFPFGVWNSDLYDEFLYLGTDLNDGSYSFGETLQ